MFITCLDLEGVLVPEIWIAFAEASGIPELKRTTRDEPDYDKLMKWRLGILKEHGLGLKEIQETIEKIDPMPGARAFLDELRELGQVIIISVSRYFAVCFTSHDVRIHLLKCSPCRAVHERKGHHHRCQHRGCPGESDLNTEILQKEDADGPFHPKQI